MKPTKSANALITTLSSVTGTVYLPAGVACRVASARIVDSLFAPHRALPDAAATLPPAALHARYTDHPAGPVHGQGQRNIRRRLRRPVSPPLQQGSTHALAPRAHTRAPPNSVWPRRRRCAASSTRSSTAGRCSRTGASSSSSWSCAGPNSPSATQAITHWLTRPASRWMTWNRTPTSTAAPYSTVRRPHHRRLKGYTIHVCAHVYMQTSWRTTGGCGRR
jgi:hypothetical protein